MTKKDLRTGMHVEVRCGKHYLVMKDAVTRIEDGDFLCNLDGSSYCTFNTFNDDLTNQINNKFDIMKVYKSICPDSLATTDMNSGVCIWERLTYYNGKVVCVRKDNHFVTVGKIYEFKEGKSVDDYGSAFPLIDKVKSVEHLNEVIWSDFIEVVE